MRVLALSSQKGGSGKTTLSGHLAVQAQRAGYGPVCLIDIDPQGSLADWWNEREDEMPAFAQTTVARLGADLEVLRQQGFRLAVVDTPPAITMAIQSVIQVAELVVIPTRPSPHDLRAVGATVDLCERAGKPLIFVVNGATPKAKITYRGRGRAVAARHRRPGHPPPPHRFRRLDDRRPHGDGGRSQFQVGPRGRRALGLYRRPARKEFPPHRLLRARRPGAPEPRPASRLRLRPARGRPVREARDERSTALRLALLRPARPQGRGQAGHAPAGLRPAWRFRGSRLERHGPRSPPTELEHDLPEHVPSSIAALTPAPKPDPPREERARGRRAAARHRRELRGRERRGRAKRRARTEERPRRRRSGQGAGPGRAAAQARRARRRRRRPQGRLHASARRRAPSAPAPRHRGHRPLGAADRDRARSTSCSPPFPKSKRWPSGSRARPSQAELSQQKAAMR